MKTYRIDGKNFDTLETFYEEISSVLIPDVSWGRNLNAFNDILRGGFGTPDAGFELIWANAPLSKQRLGYPETIRQLELRLKHCHPTARRSVKTDLRNAQQHEGAAVFDWLVEIIRVHGADGEEADSNVVLTLA